MTKPNNHAEFYRRLGDLLEEYGVEISPYNDDEIRVEFAEPYRCNEVSSLDPETCRELEEGCDGDS